MIDNTSSYTLCGRYGDADSCQRKCSGVCVYSPGTGMLHYNASVSYSGSIHLDAHYDNRTEQYNSTHICVVGQYYYANIALGVSAGIVALLVVSGLVYSFIHRARVRKQLAML